MTDHKTLKMHREKVRVTDKEMIKAILSDCHVATLALHDEPYPYAVPMNYGYEWEDELVLYFHMAVDGHRINLINKNNKVAVSIHQFLERAGGKAYRNETHDYRGVNIFGTAEIIKPDRPEEYMHGFSVLTQCNFRPPVKQITEEMYRRLWVLKITADVVTAKAQYPITTVSEVPMPPFEAKE